MNASVLQTATESIEEIDSVVVRFAGDSGDGMQLAGSRLTSTSALAGNDVATFPDFPAEIRAPKGTLAGVSGFQVHFAARDIHTPGDMADVLVAMNPAALVENLRFLRPHGTLVVDEDAFDAKGLKLAHVESNPLDDGSLGEFNLVRVPLTSLTREAVEGPGVGRKLATRCRNFFAMGLIYWLYGRDLEPTLRWARKRLRDEPEALDANVKALRVGAAIPRRCRSSAAAMRRPSTSSANPPCRPPATPARRAAVPERPRASRPRCAPAGCCSPSTSARHGLRPSQALDGMAGPASPPSVRQSPGRVPGAVARGCRPPTPAPVAEPNALEMK